VDITDLINRTRAGDRNAFADVVQHYQRPLFGFLGRMGLGQAHAEDIAQETFLRAWQNLGDFNPRRAGFSTWLFTLARNLTLNDLARASSRCEVTMGDDFPDPPGDQPQPETVMLATEQKRQMRMALRRIPLSDRTILALAYIDEFDLRAIGKIEGCSTGAIKTRLHRARMKLREYLENPDE